MDGKTAEEMRRVCVFAGGGLGSHQVSGQRGYLYQDAEGVVLSTMLRQ